LQKKDIDILFDTYSKKDVCDNLRRIRERNEQTQLESKMSGLFESLLLRDKVEAKEESSPNKFESLSEKIHKQMQMQIKKQ